MQSTRQSSAARSKAWRENNKERANEYQRQKRAAKVKEIAPKRGYHMAECSGKCQFYQRCSMWRLELTQALPVRESLSAAQIQHLARRLPCEAG